MNDAMVTVGAYLDAFGRKDMKRLRNPLADGFTFKGPLMAFDNPDAFVAAMAAFPCEVTADGSRFVADGARVAHAFVWRIKKPVKADIPMCEMFEVEGGRILSSELYYDSKLFPSMPGQG